MSNEITQTGRRAYEYRGYSIRYVGGRYSQRGWEVRDAKEIKRYHAPIFCTKEDAIAHADELLKGK